MPINRREFAMLPAGTMAGPLFAREFYPIGGQKVRMKLPPARRVTQVELPRAEAKIPFRVTGVVLEFTIPRVLDYEVAAI